MFFIALFLTITAFWTLLGWVLGRFVGRLGIWVFAILLMAISGHVSRRMIEHYSHIRMEAKRAALDAIAAQPPQTVFGAGGAQNWAQSPTEEKSTAAS